MGSATMTKISRGLLLAPVVLGAALLAPSGARADYSVSNDQGFSYVGTVTGPDTTVYAIPSFVSGLTTYTGRDGSISSSSNAPTGIVGAGNENTMQFQTNWYATTQPGNGYGWGNPNNSNTGFLAINDFTNHSVTSASGSWDAAMTTFTLHVSGANASYSPDLTRLWAPTGVSGLSSDTRGTYDSYELTLTATFATPATEEIPGWFSTAADPMSITGSFTGLFTNDSPDTSLNGDYIVDVTFQNQNWAKDNAAAFAGPSYFGSDVVPEPASMLLLAGSLAGLALARRRR